MNKEIPIFFTIDDAYAPPLAVALCSAIKNSSLTRNYRAYVLYKELSDENKSKLKSLEKEHFKIEFFEMKDTFSQITDRMSNRLRCDYFTLTIYFRLFIPELFASLDKAVYIDSDVLVADDIAKLFDTPLGENYIGACPDLSIVDAPPLVKYTKEAVGMPEGKYINSGVLLMDLKKLRESNFQEHFLSLLNEYHFDSIAPDQDYINACLCGKILYLDKRWDVMPNPAQPESTDLGIVHYNLFSKPWCYDEVQYQDIFWEYAKCSGYYDELKENNRNYSDEQKAKDSECMQLLCKRGEEIAGKDITFKKMFESGVKIRL